MRKLLAISFLLFTACALSNNQNTGLDPQARPTPCPPEPTPTPRPPMRGLTCIETGKVCDCIDFPPPGDPTCVVCVRDDAGGIVDVDDIGVVPFCPPVIPSPIPEPTPTPTPSPTPTPLPTPTPPAGTCPAVTNLKMDVKELADIVVDVTPRGPDCARCTSIGKLCDQGVCPLGPEGPNPEDNAERERCEKEAGPYVFKLNGVECTDRAVGCFHHNTNPLQVKVVAPGLLSVEIPNGTYNTVEIALTRKFKRSTRRSLR